MTRLSLKVLLCIALLLLSLETEAARRAIRIEFNEWDEAQTIGSGDCPGSDGHSTEVLWNGIRFSGAGSTVYLTEAYCQHSFNYEGDEFGDWVNEDYFNQGFVNEPGMADLFGSNDTEPLITAIRYTYLDGDRDEPGTNGFQWAFYFFPGDITIVALYGLTGITLDNTSYIKKGGTSFWQGDVDGFDGEYFCFRNANYVGTWDGSSVGSEEGVACPLMLDDGFEDD